MPPIKTYAELQAFLNGVLKANGNDIGDAPHGAWWNTQTYDEFVNGTVPGFSSVKTLVSGNSAQSNIILALQGVGPLFGPSGKYGQMPGDGPPYFTDAQIKEVADWIDAGCPN